MSITTYAELQTAIGNWLDRSDLTLRIPEFIALFEAKINRRLRVRQQITSTNLTPSSGSASLPSDYLEWKRVTWTGSVRRSLEYVLPEYLQTAYPTSPSDTPRFFTIEGSTLKIRPIDATVLEFLYAQKVPALTDAATTNWLLTAHPDAYLFGSLTEAAGFTSDLAMGPVWDLRAKEALGEIQSLSWRTQGPAMIRPYGETP